MENRKCISCKRATRSGVPCVGNPLIFRSQILTAPDLTYASSFALIDAELLALVNLQTNTLDIHRLVGGVSSKKLHRIRQLCLPIPRAGCAQPLPASYRLSQACLTMSSSRSRSRCLPFRPSPDACLVGLTAFLETRNGAMTFYWLTMRRDYLCADLESGCGMTSWETWSARTACCVELEHPLLTAPIPAGARWLVYSQPHVVRGFGLSRSARPADNARAVGVREALQDVFASQLPCCDVISVGESKYQSISADYEWVVGMNEEVRHRATACPFVEDLSCAQRRVTNFPGGYTASISITSLTFSLRRSF